MCGRVESWLSALVLAWGVQLTLGHFQIPMWTAGLVLMIGCGGLRLPIAVRAQGGVGFSSAMPGAGRLPPCSSP